MKLILTLLFVVAPACLAWAQTGRSVDEARIRQIIQDEQNAWNRGDAKAYCAHMLDDASLTNIVGTVYYGRAEVQKRVADIFGTIFKGSTIAEKVQKIRFIRPDVALVDIDVEVSGYQGLPPGVRAAADGKLHTRLQELMVKERGDWSVMALHNVDVKMP